MGSEGNLFTLSVTAVRRASSPFWGSQGGASRHTFSRGEGGFKIAQIWAILKTEEEFGRSPDLRYVFQASQNVIL